MQSKFNVMIVMDGILVTSGNRFLIAISTITPPVQLCYLADNQDDIRININYCSCRAVYGIGLLSEKGQQAFFMSDVKLNYN